MIILPYKKETKQPIKSKQDNPKGKQPEIINDNEIEKHKSKGVIRGIE